MAAGLDVTTALRTKVRRGWAVIAAAVSIVLFALAANFKSSGPYSIRIVDASTGRPIEHAHVVMDFPIMRGFPSEVQVGSFKTTEGATDKEGWVRFPAWGPRFTLWPQRDTPHSPVILVFRAAYGSQIITAGTDSYQTALPAAREEQEAALHLQLQPMEVTSRQYALSVSFLYYPLSVIRPNCNWRRIPRFIEAIGMESDRLVAAGFEEANRATLQVFERSYWGMRCGELRALFQQEGS